MSILRLGQAGWIRRNFLTNLKAKDLVDQIVVMGIFGHTV